MAINGIIKFGEKVETNSEEKTNVNVYAKFEDGKPIKVIPLRRWSTDLNDELAVQRFPRHSVFTSDGKGFYAACVRNVEGVDSCPICDYANYLKSKDSEKYKAIYNGLWARMTYSLNVLVIDPETGEWVEKLWFFGAKIRESFSDIANSISVTAEKYKDKDGAKNNILGQVLEVVRSGQKLDTVYSIRQTTQELKDVGIKKLPEMTLMLENYLGITDPAVMLEKLADIGYVIPNNKPSVAVDTEELNLSKL